MDLDCIVDSVLDDFVPVKDSLGTIRIVNCLYPKVYNGNMCKCGRCILCRVSERSQWSLRIDLEGLTHTNNVFSTCTYAPEYVPIELQKKDSQDFLKRLRKNLDYKIRFFGAGEYGDRFTLRPHFHYVFFGLDYKDFPVIKQSWNQGFTEDTCLSSARSNYVCGYVQKKLSFFYQDDRIPKDFYDWSFLQRAEFCKKNNIVGYDYRLRPFALMSRRPGLGAFWYEEHKKEMMDKFFIPMNGIRRPIPRFFRERLKLDFDGWELRFADYLERKLIESFNAYKKRYHNDDVGSFYDYERERVKHRAEEFKRKNELYLMKKQERDKRSKVV